MRKILLILLTAVLFLGCNKHECTKPTHTTNAVIRYTGMVEADGCDWVIKTDATTSYHADNLADSFKEDGLNVRVSFSLTGKEFICGWNARLPIIHITHIEK